VFSIAVITWEMLAQRRLFRGDRDPDTTRNVVSEQAPRVSEVVPQLGAGFDDAIACGLAKDPARRHEAVARFAEEIETAAWRRGCVAAEAEVAACIHGLAPQALLRRDAILRALVAEPPRLRSGVEEASSVDAEVVTDDMIEDADTVVDPPPRAPRPEPSEAPKPEASSGPSRSQLLVALAVLAPVAVMLLGWTSYVLDLRVHPPELSLVRRDLVAPRTSDIKAMAPLRAPEPARAAPVQTPTTNRASSPARSAQPRPRAEPSRQASSARDDGRDRSAVASSAPADEVPSNPYGS